MTTAQVATWQQRVARLLPPTPAIPPEWRDSDRWRHDTSLTHPATGTADHRDGPKEGHACQ